MPLIVGGCNPLKTDSIQELVVTTWKAVLGRQEVGIDEFFFDLGGGSLEAFRVVADLERKLGIRVPMTILFESPTVRLLVASLHKISEQGKSTCHC